jgi:hypothetical protein
MDKKLQIQLDKELIALLGGSSALSKRLGLSIQRVHNWSTRGIPPSIKIAYPKLFLNKRIKK